MRETGAMSPLMATGAFLDAFFAKDEQPCGESCKSGDFAEAAWDCLQPAAGTAKVWGVENRRAVPKTCQSQ